MYFETQDKTYTTLRNLSFAPEIDLTSQELIINGFTVDIETEENINSGQPVQLINDGRVNDITWVRYWVEKVKRINKKIVTVSAKSMLFFLDRYTMDAKLYNNWRLDTALNEVFNKVVDTTLDVRYNTIPIREIRINGYCPKQTARERLQSILMATGTYIQEDYGANYICVYAAPSLFFSLVNIDPGVLFPPNWVFMKPELIENDAVSRMNVTYYNVTSYDPGTSDAKTIQDDNGNTYWYTENGSRTHGPGTGNEITISGNILVDQASNQRILDNLIAYYMTFTDRVEAEIINDGVLAPSEGDIGFVFPGMLVTVPYDVDKKQLAVGHVRQVEYSFGLHIRSKLTMFPAKVVNGVQVIFKYVCDGVTVCTETGLYTNNYTIVIPSGTKQVLTNGHLYKYVHNRIEAEAGDEEEIEISCSLISDQNLITGEIT